MLSSSGASSDDDDFLRKIEHALEDESPPGNQDEAKSTSKRRASKRAKKEKAPKEVSPPRATPKKKKQPSKSATKGSVRKRKSGAPLTARSDSTTDAAWPRKNEQQYRRKMNDASFLNTLHLVVKRHAVSTTSGLHLSVDWEAVKAELQLESARYARGLVQFCEHHNNSFREALCLVRNSKAQDHPLLPSSLAKLPEKIRMVLPPARRLAKEERAMEAMRMLCFTEEANWDEDLWKEMTDYLGKDAMRAAEREMRASNLTLRLRWGFRPSGQWLQVLEPTYLSRDLFVHTDTWAIDGTGGGEAGDAPKNKGTEILDAGTLPPQIPDEFAVHAIRAVANGTVSIDLEWRDNYHHESKGRGPDRPTGVILRRVPQWEQPTSAQQLDAEPVVADEVVLLRRAPLKPRILERVRLDGDAGTALGVLLSETDAALSDCVWVLRDMCEVGDLLAVSAQDDVFFVAPEFSAPYYFENTLLQPRNDMRGNVIRWTELRRALLDLVMRYPRITLQGLERKVRVGCGLTWHLLCGLIGAAVVRFEVHPIETVYPQRGFQLEFLAEDAAFARLSQYIQSQP